MCALNDVTRKSILYYDMHVLQTLKLDDKSVVKGIAALLPNPIHFNI